MPAGAYAPFSGLVFLVFFMVTYGCHSKGCAADALGCQPVTDPKVLAASHLAIRDILQSIECRGAVIKYVASTGGGRFEDVLASAMAKKSLSVGFLGDSVGAGECDYTTEAGGRKQVRHGYFGRFTDTFRGLFAGDPEGNSSGVAFRTQNVAAPGQGPDWYRACGIAKLSPLPEVVVIEGVRAGEVAVIEYEKLVRTLLGLNIAVVLVNWSTLRMVRAWAQEGGEPHDTASRSFRRLADRYHTPLVDVSMLLYDHNHTCPHRGQPTLATGRKQHTRRRPLTFWERHQVAVYDDMVHPNGLGHALIGGFLERLFLDGLRQRPTPLNGRPPQSLPPTQWEVDKTAVCAPPSAMKPQGRCEFELKTFQKGKESFYGWGVGSSCTWSVPRGCGELALVAYLRAGQGAGIVKVDGEYKKTIEANILGDPAYKWLGPRGIPVAFAIHTFAEPRPVPHNITVTVNVSAGHHPHQPVFQVKELRCSQRLA